MAKEEYWRTQNSKVKWKIWVEVIIISWIEDKRIESKEQNWVWREIQAMENIKRLRVEAKEANWKGKKMINMMTLNILMTLVR